MRKIRRKDAILAWHFVADRNGVPVLSDYDKTSPDSDALIVAPGYIYTTDEPEILVCLSGLHGSVSALDALRYAQGPWLCRTAHWGEVDEEFDKFASRHREVLAVVDASSELRLFACWCVRQIWHLVTDERSRRVVEVAEAFARGTATGEELAAALGAAKDAALNAARAAVRDTAWGSAWGAARDTALNAAWGAARGAAWGAALGTVRDAAWAAAWDAQCAELERRMLALVGGK